MTRKINITLCCLATILLQHASEVSANDSAAAYGAGGITFKKIDGIVMESENLIISPFEVTVAYVFRNVTASDIKTRVAFPLPMITKHDEDEDINIDMGSPNPRTLRAYDQRTTSAFPDRNQENEKNFPRHLSLDSDFSRGQTGFRFAQIQTDSRFVLYIRL